MRQGTGWVVLVTKRVTLTLQQLQWCCASLSADLPAAFHQQQCRHHRQHASCSRDRAVNMPGIT
jgi:hypothetical protein